ncbi:GPI anchored peptidase m48 [Diplocarpon rosae]|nr:GPI anchored peptidase m48 [Diplocarpon rosae]
MLTRALAGSLRTFTLSAPRALSRTPIRNLPRTPGFISHRYESGWGYPPPPPPRKPTRVVYSRWDPEEVERAKPLFTDEQLIKSLRSPTTKWILVLAGGSALIFYYSNLETVPVSGRKRFNCFSDAFVEAEGEKTCRKIIHDHANAILPAWDPRTTLVNKVMAKLIPASGLEHVNWEVHVIDSPEANAFVIPGGKVFEAVKVWERMEASQMNHNIPEWMSTHPSNSSRIAQILKWLPKAEEAQSESNCSFTWGHFDGFQKSLNSEEWAVIFKS